MRLHLMFACLAFLGGFAVVRAQAPVGRVVVPALRHFQRTPDGNWRTTFRTPDGRSVTFVYEPPTKLVPRVLSTFTLENASRAEFLYEWEIENGSASVQQLALLRAEGGLPPATLRQWPVGWQVFPEAGQFFMFGPMIGTQTVPSGIASGSRELLTFTVAGFLPGPKVVIAAGNAPIGADIPPGMPPDAADELQRLADTNQGIRVRTIGPAMPAGYAPELTTSILAARVASEYHLDLVLSKHPLVAEFLQAFERLVDAEPSAVTSALHEIQATAREPVTDPWHRSLSQGLLICVDLLLSGAVPLVQSVR